VCWHNIPTHVHSFVRKIKSHFQPITGYGGVLGTAMSCQPGVVGDPERTLNQDFASISRPASAHHQRCFAPSSRTQNCGTGRSTRPPALRKGPGLFDLGRRQTYARSLVSGLSALEMGAAQACVCQQDPPARSDRCSIPFRKWTRRLNCASASPRSSRCFFVRVADQGRGAPPFRSVDAG
jgi:hypothetical protein